jgi:hypothetical protein
LPLVFERIECREFIEALTALRISIHHWSHVAGANCVLPDFAEIRHL